MDKLSEKILRIIKDANPRVTSSEIQATLNIEETHLVTNPNTRALIKEVMRIEAIQAGFPIGADSKGYFLIRTQEEFDAYCDNLRNRILGIVERLELVKTAWEKCREQDNQPPT